MSRFGVRKFVNRNLPEFAEENQRIAAPGWFAFCSP